MDLVQEAEARVPCERNKLWWRGCSDWPDKIDNVGKQVLLTCGLKPVSKVFQRNRREPGLTAEDPGKVYKSKSLKR